MPTITDVSRKAGVSRSTVSRLIAGSGYVSESARKAVEAAIAELGYRPNTMARGLRSNRSNLIGGVVVNVGSPFYAQMIGGIQLTCRSANKSFLVSSGYADPDQEARAILELIDRSCDGLILYLENPLREDVLAVIEQSGIPVVTIGGDECPAARAAIAIDNFSGARDGMEFLLNAGHRKIAYLSGGLIYRDMRERLRGAADALAGHGMTMEDILVIHGNFEERFGAEATATLLVEHPEVTAIFGGDDDISAGALLSLKRAGKRVPEDISLLGFDDNFHARHLTPALTTVRQPVDEAGKLAARLLLSLLDGEAPAARAYSIPTELIIRDSVGPAPTSLSG